MKSNNNFTFRKVVLFFCFTVLLVTLNSCENLGLGNTTLSHEGSEIGSVKIFTPTFFKIKITNTGKHTLNIDSIVISSMYFTSPTGPVYDNGKNDLSPLNKGKSREFEFFILPEITGPTGAIISFYSNNIKGSTAYVVEVKGNCISRQLKSNPMYPTWSDCFSGSMNISASVGGGRSYQTVSTGNWKIRMVETVDSLGYAYFEVSKCGGTGLLYGTMASIIELDQYDTYYCNSSSILFNGNVRLKAKFPAKINSFVITCNISNEYTRPITIYWE